MPRLFRSLIVSALCLGITASPAGAVAGDFAPAPTSPEAVGDRAYRVAVGDFNGDRDEDLAVVNFGSDNVTILLGDGTGDFTPAPASPEAVGDQPHSVAVGDFNGDGRQDLAVANLASDNVTILLGDGSGNFTPAPLTSPEPVGDEPISVAVGNFNGDTHQDLAVSNAGSGNITILLGDGSGNFTPPPTSPEAAGGGRPQSVTVSDFNGDGRQDLAVANFLSRRVTILLGEGNGDFMPAATSPEEVGDRPISLAVGDFNGDGRGDLAVANLGSDNVTILLGDGTGDFAPAPTGPEAVGDAPASVAVADFDGDGRPDLAVANEASDNLTILIGRGTGDFTRAPTSPEAVGTAPNSVAVGDFNGDGGQDLAVANFGSHNVTVLLNQVPETTIDSGPQGPTSDATPEFEFSAEDGASFECRVDGGEFADCSSPHTTDELDDGEHTFAVRARDAAGNVDQSPAERTFTVDSEAEETTPPPEGDDEVEESDQGKDDSKNEDDHTPDPEPAGGQVLGVATPLVSNLRVDPSTFAVALGGVNIAAHRTGTRVSYRLSEPALVRFSVERQTVGRQTGSRCVAPTRSNSGRRGCTRYVTLPGSFSHASGTGPNAFHFTGRLPAGKLSPGRYRLVAIPTNAAGSVGPAMRVGFGVIPSSPPRPPRFTG